MFPFATTVAERFGRSTKFKTPVIESTGSGGGMKLFCAGIGLEHPDITNASRRIKSKEFQKCQANGIDLTEIVVGFDGIVVANAKSGPPLKLTFCSKSIWRPLKWFPTPIGHVRQIGASRLPIRIRNGAILTPPCRI